jgi:hypothetical protein
MAKPKKFFDAAVGKAPGVSRFIAPGDTSRATTHGGFDDDVTTMKSVIAFIKDGRPR